MHDFSGVPPAHPITQECTAAVQQVVCGRTCACCCMIMVHPGQPQGWLQRGHRMLHSMHGAGEGQQTLCATMSLHFGWLWGQWQGHPCHCN